MEPVEAVSAIPGQGLEGDRYATGRGTYSEYPEDGRQVTLFEQETLEALHRDLDIALEARETGAIAESCVRRWKEGGVSW